MRRRSNFYGKIIKCYVGSQTSFMEFKEQYKYDAPYFPNNKTYLVNEYTTGIFSDVIKILAERLNFTIELYKQEKEKWGDAYTFENGSIMASGFVGEVYNRNVDIAVASVSITQTRANHLSFLLPIATETLAMFIPSKSISESLDFLVFIKPLNPNLWMIVFITSIFIAIARKSSAIIKTNEDFWSSLMVFFGGAIDMSTQNVQSYKIVVVTSLFAGYVTWTNYNAFLTSELLTVKKHYPFKDLESLSRTNWRYNLNP